LYEIRIPDKDLREDDEYNITYFEHILCEQIVVHTKTLNVIPVEDWRHRNQ
jgi:hypothetical protein